MGAEGGAQDSAAGSGGAVRLAGEGIRSGAVLLLLRLAIGTARARWVRSGAVWADGQWTSARCAAPVTVGWLRPQVILPEGWRDWSAQQLQAVLTHEQEHASNRDPLVQWLALLNRAVFWFHPLAWCVERKLAALAEEACDAVVLARGHDPQEYSGYLLEMAQAVRRSGVRVQAWGMGMPGSFLARRIRQILGQQRPTPVSRARLVCAALSCALLSTLFGATTVERRRAMPAVLAQVRTPQSGAEAQLRVLYFDMTRLSVAEQAWALAFSQNLLRNDSRRQDSFAVVVNRGPRAEVLQDFTTERDRVLAVLQEIDPGKSSDSGGNEGLQRVLPILKPVQGKKALIYFIGQAGAPAATRELVDAAVRATVALFPIDVRNSAGR